MLSTSKPIQTNPSQSKPIQSNIYLSCLSMYFNIAIKLFFNDSANSIYAKRHHRNTRCVVTTNGAKISPSTDDDDNGN